LKAQGKGDVMILLGGIIYQEDFSALKDMGVEGIFIPGTPLEDIIRFVREQIPQIEKKQKVA